MDPTNLKLHNGDFNEYYNGGQKIKLYNKIIMLCLQNIFNSHGKRSMLGDYMLEWTAFVRLMYNSLHTHAVSIPAEQTMSM